MELRQHRGTSWDRSMRAFPQAEVDGYRLRGDWRSVSLVDDFLSQVATRPDKVAISTHRRGAAEPERVTYAELGSLVDQFAFGLLDAGVAPGDVVAIQLPNGWEGPALALAALRVGAVPNPIPIIYRDREVHHMVSHAGAKCLFVPSHFRGFAHGVMGLRLRDEVPTLDHVFVVGGDESVPPAARFATRFSSPTPSGASETLAALAPSADDVAMIVFTSGTTGLPKAAMHTHNTAWSGHHRVVREALSLTADDVVFMASTIGHTTGFIDGMLHPLSTGQKVVYQDVWDAGDLLAMLDEEQVTWTLSATTFAVDMLRVLGERPRLTSTFRAFACGGAAIPPPLAQEMNDRFGIRLVPLWGCTESGISTIHTPGTSIQALSASDGQVVAWQEVRVADDEGLVVPDGGLGSLQVRGPSVFAGYYKQPDMTAASFTGDGWLETGDLGRRRSGTIRVEGRTKDVIIRGGQNISALDTENALHSHPAIQQVAVVGYPDERLGERACAVVVSPVGLTFDEMVTYLESIGMAKQYWPERLVLVDEMPQTPSGKIQKFVLREQLANGDLTERGAAKGI